MSRALSPGTARRWTAGGLARRWLQQRSPVVPAVPIVLGFAGLILVGTMLLMLPVASAGGAATSPLDALFTATSAVCVTGLVLYDTGTYWSGVGQAILLLLMQLGGLGFMTSATLLLLLFGRRVSLRERLLIQVELGDRRLGGLEGLVARIIGATLLVEVLGAAVLTVRLAVDLPLGTAVWYGLFHSVSAVTNASFDLFGAFQSLARYRHDGLILTTIAGLIILGGLGVSTLADLARVRAVRRLTLESKLILSVTGGLLLIAAAAILALEWGNPATLGALPGLDLRLLNAFFHAVVPRTAGFTSLDVGRFTEASLVVTILLMVIGGAPGSMAGGVKVTTVAVLLAAVLSTVRGQPHIVAFGREIPLPVVTRALTVLLLALALVLAAAIALTISEGVRFTVALFEAASAFATVGMTTGLTPSLSTTGKVVLVVTMFAGRLGPLTLALALTQRQRPTTYRYAAETVKIG